MADDGTKSERLNEQLARYTVSPGLMEDMRARAGEAPPKPKRRRRRKSGIGAAVADDVGDDPAEETPPAEPPRGRVVVELNADYTPGLPQAMIDAKKMLAAIGVPAALVDGESSRYFVFARLTLADLETLATVLAQGDRRTTPIYKIWRDEPLKPLLTRSLRTIKADACSVVFGADGTDIVVAIADSGVDREHPHFKTYATLDLPPGLSHRAFDEKKTDPGVDEYGHGTHVAGIIAGRTCSDETAMVLISDERGADKTVLPVAKEVPRGESQTAKSLVFQGVAARAKIMSLKVLDGKGEGHASALIAALEHVADTNDNGRRIRVHCVNLSVGYPFDAKWFAAGQSPLCAVVNRLVRSGVVVVAAAGNDGSTLQAIEGRGTRQRVGVDQSINDPGNAEEAITVGATHAESPHLYGVSFFSSRGPTSDGRPKPDLVAPGERIVSCAAGRSDKLVKALEAAEKDYDPTSAYFREESGTSMAAPHVAGAVAALLSVRREFIGRPEAVKQILLGSCTDLKRKGDYQGAGLIDVLRALQSI